MKLFLILVLHLRQFFIVIIFVKRATYVHFCILLFSGSRHQICTLLYSVITLPINSLEAKTYYQLMSQNPKYQNQRKLARSFNFTFRYIYDVLSLNNYRVGDFVHPIYPIELAITDTTYTDRFYSYLDLHREIDREGR